MGRKLDHVDIVCGLLIEAELRSTMRRLELPLDETIYHGIQWITPHRRLTPEIKGALRHSYLRGADLYHLSCALFFFDTPAGNYFLTLDSAQREAAAQLGFLTDWSFA